MRFGDEDLGKLDGLLDQNLMALLKQAIYLLEREMRQPATGRIRDYGYLVYSMALVYEGFLKRWLYALGVIGIWQLRNPHFRIGRALNPDLPERYRDQTWVYQGLGEMCGEKTAEELWRAWKLGRNRVFHYDLVQQRKISLNEAEMKLALFLDAMLLAAACERRVKREGD